MLVPKPPRPVARRRAVAEMIVAVKQVAPIRAGHVFELPAPAPAADGADTSPKTGSLPSQSDHDTPV